MKLAAITTFLTWCSLVNMVVSEASFIVEGIAIPFGVEKECYNEVSGCNLKVSDVI